MSGILTRLAVGANSGLLRGLLTSAFDICLLFWHPRFWQKGQGEARRRPNFQAGVGQAGLVSPFCCRRRSRRLEATQKCGY